MRRRRMQRSPSAGGHGAGAVPYGGGYDSVHGRGRFGTGRFGGGMFGGNRAAGPYAHQNMGQAGAGGPTMPEPTYGGVGDKQGYAAVSCHITDNNFEVSGADYSRSRPAHLHTDRLEN